jgi:hypothetical protein
MALQLHAITLADGAQSENPSDGRHTGMFAAVRDEIQFLPFRDLCAVVSEQKLFALEEPTPNVIERHRAIVDGIFRRAAVLPVPMGTIFRAEDVLTSWMELHYVSLTGALQFVEDRAVARVHIIRGSGKEEEREAGADLAAAAAESFRALRRRAVGVVPLRTEHMTAVVLSASFLVERDLWKEFLHAIEEQKDAHNHLQFDVTGPWAPYDFVGMRFGG